MILLVFWWFSMKIIGFGIKINDFGRFFIEKSLKYWKIPTSPTSMSSFSKLRRSWKLYLGIFNSPSGSMIYCDHLFIFYRWLDISLTSIRALDFGAKCKVFLDFMTYFNVGDHMETLTKIQNTRKNRKLFWSSSKK